MRPWIPHLSKECHTSVIIWANLKVWNCSLLLKNGHVQINCNYQVLHQNLTSFHIKNNIKQIWPCRKEGQGHAKVITWIILVVLGSQMIHTEFQGHLLTGSGENFFKVFNHIGAWRPYWSCEQNYLIAFYSSKPWRLCMKFVNNGSSVFRICLNFVNIWETKIKGQRMALISCTHKSSCTNFSIKSINKLLCSSIFQYLSTKIQIWYCSKKRSKLTQGHQLNNLGSTPVPDATNPSFKAFGQSISREDFILKPFTILGCHFGYGIGDYFCGCYISVHFCGFIKKCTVL